MNLLDYILIVILGYCLVRGIFRGLVKELSAIVGVLGGFYAAYTYYPKIVRYLADWVTNPGYLKVISFLIIFVAVFLIVGIVGVVIKYLMNIAFLGWVDRITGALFGTAKAMLIILVLISALTTFLPSNTPMVKKSWVAEKTMYLSAYLVQVTPVEMKQGFEKKMKALNKSWKTQ